MRRYCLIVSLLMILFAGGAIASNAQEGDQILDGIGETGLISRYIFNGNIKDWSRNNLHATIHGADYKYVNDSQFGQVLSLNGNQRTFISLPSTTLTSEEAISVTGWYYLRSDKNGQSFFDFGNDSKAHFSASLINKKGKSEFVAQIQSKSKSYLSTLPALEVNKWNHVAIVVNGPFKTLKVYVNGVLATETKGVETELRQMFGVNAGEGNKFYIGKAFNGGKIGLNASLYDFRIYRIALNARQIARIHKNALSEGESAVRTNEEADAGVQQFDESTPQLYNAHLVNVPDIEVETEVGCLPQLPRHVQGIYRNNIKGPKVRVIWPSPKDNSQVLSPNTYTITGKVSGTNLQPKAVVVVKEATEHLKPVRTLDFFALDEVSLNVDLHSKSTKFIENRNKFITSLAQTNPDDFLYMFRNAFGQTQPQGAKPLGVWDSQETKLRGHATGHYLSAIAQAYASSGYDATLKANFENKMQYMVEVLFELSKMSGKPQIKGGIYVENPLDVPIGVGKTDYDSDLSPQGIRTDYWNWGKGYISAYPPDQFIMLEKGASYGGDKTKIWAPYYTLHKIFAGLMDIYDVSGNENALDIVKGMGDWVYARLSKVPKPTLISMWNRYIAGELGGMNEAMARLYRLTNEPRYMEAAQLFDNIKVFYGDDEHSHGLAKNVDTFRGLHANQHIPQIVGALEIYRDTQVADYFYVADNFWKIVTSDYMYSIGGVAGARNPNNAECFISQPATLYENGFSTGGQNETCATYNMLKLTENLFMFNQRGELMDYYERGLYNHILASVAEHHCGNTYHVPLNAGAIKHFGNEDMSGFTCCNGTALESSTKLQRSVYFKSIDNKSLYVNLFVPSTLTWKEREIVVTQSTSFPKSDITMLKIGGNGNFDLNVRVPHWAQNGVFVKINGESIDVNATPERYLTINRNWRNGDVVELRMPFHFYLEPVMDQQNIASLFYGPVLLAAQETEPLTHWRKVSLNLEDISKSIKGNPETLEFTIDGILFRPFYDTYERHSVYLDVELK